MAEFPALSLWTDAYLGDTTHLTTIEHGAYLLLLMVAWRSRDICLPDDDVMLARYTKLTPGQWRRMRPILERFFDVENGRWTQSRLTDEANRVRQVRESQAANGRASALKRKGRHSTERQPSVNETRTPTTTTTTTVIDVAKATSALARKAGGFGPPDGVNLEAWNVFCAQRKKGITEIAYGRMLATLAECATAGWPPGEIVARSIEKSWETLYLPTEHRNGNGTANGHGRPHRRADEIDDAAVALGFER